MEKSTVFFNGKKYNNKAKQAAQNIAVTKEVVSTKLLPINVSCLLWSSY